MIVYRAPPASAAEIELLTRDVTFGSRLRMGLRQRRGYLAIFGLVPLVLPAFLALVTIGSGYSTRIFLWGALAGEAMFLLPLLLATVLGSLLPSPNEHMLPRRLVLREDAIQVTPREGPTSLERWTWLVRALETRRSFILVIYESPYVEMTVPKSVLPPDKLELLGRWLRQHDCLRD